MPIPVSQISTLSSPPRRRQPTRIRPFGVYLRALEIRLRIICSSNVGSLFTDAPLPNQPLDGAAGRQHEEVRLGRRQLFVFYPDGMAKSRLRLPAERTGTARNLNTVAKLAELARGIDQQAQPI